MENIIEQYKRKPYALEISSEFQDSFFADRHKVADETRRYSERNNGVTDGNLTALKGGTVLWGASTVEENFLLDSIIRDLRPNVAVEIGLYRGQTALTITRALKKYSQGSSYFGFDISKASIDITDALLSAEQLQINWLLSLQGFSGTLPADSAPEFVFVDGDHSYEGAARDIVASYNAMKNGIIAIHDIGSPHWGFTHQEPGILFHQVLPRIAGDKVEFSWLDSMCRDLTMRMLSPITDARYHYTTAMAEATEIGARTMKDTVDGWGGIGLMRKKHRDHQLNLEEILAAKPKQRQQDDQPAPRRRSIVSRALRKAAELVP